MLMFLVILSAGLALSPKQAAAVDDSYIKPVSGAIALRYMSKYKDGDGKSRTHHGIDIAAPAESPVRSSAGGKVTFAGKTPLGFCATVLHQSGVKTTYLPLASLDVAKGDVVTQGQRLGSLSASGDKSGGSSHLHMGAIFGGEYINPEDLFSGVFSADFSKLIRRGNIPPADSAPGAMSPGASSWQFPLLSYAGRLFSEGATFLQKVWHFLDRSGSYLAKQARYIYKSGKKLFKSHLSRTLPRPVLVPSALISRTGFAGWRRFLSIKKDFTVVFDPSGDRDDPTSRVRILPLGGQSVVSADIYDGNAALIRHIGGWEGSSDGLFWTGDDSRGRIVENGRYSIVVNTLDGRVSICIAEVKWHLY